MYIVLCSEELCLKECPVEPLGGLKFGWIFNQTSTLGGRNLVEISTKLRPVWGRNLVEVSTKLRPTNVDFWLKFQLKIHMCICVLLVISVKRQHTKVQLWLTHQQHNIMCWFILWSVNSFFNVATTRVSCLSCIALVIHMWWKPSIEYPNRMSSRTRQHALDCPPLQSSIHVSLHVTIQVHLWASIWRSVQVAPTMFCFTVCHLLFEVSLQLSHF